MSNPEVHVSFFDTTPRDGAQSLPAQHQFPEGSKVELTDHIARLGVQTIEAGFPATPEDGEEVAAVAAKTGNTIYDVDVWQDDEQVGVSPDFPVIAGLSRTKPADVEATWDSVRHAQRPRIHTFVSTSDYHRQSKFPGVSREELIGMARASVAHAVEISQDKPEAEVEFSAEAATTTDMAYLERVVSSAIESGAHVVNVPDTVGERSPRWMYRFYSQVIEWVMRENPNVVISAHNHNDLGNAVANSFALVEAAADWAEEHEQTVHAQIETTVAGLGERAGNADIFPVAGNLMKFTGELAVPVVWRFNRHHSVNVATQVLALAGLEIDRQNPIIGNDIYRHRSGIHSDGVIKGGHQMYTPFSPVEWGHGQNAIHEDGRYQGKAGRSAVTQS